MGCFDNIIGITRTECECFSEDFNEDANVSESGLYMDELAEAPFKLSSIKVGTTLCEQLRTKMEKARSAAITAFKEELFKKLATIYTQSAQPFTGLIGSHSYTKNLPVGTTYAGMMLTSYRMLGATLKISQIDTYFAQTATFDIRIYLNDTLIETIPVSSIANSKKSNVLPTPVELPLTDNYGEPYQYKIVYATSGLTPKDNTVSCGCGGNETKLDKFFRRQGITTNDIETVSTTSYSYGLNILSTVRCGTDDIICAAYESSEFVKAVTSASIQRKSVEFLIADLLASKVIDRETMVNREVMGVNAAKLHNKFKNDIQWLADNIEVKGNCFACNPGVKHIALGGIRL